MSINFLHIIGKYITFTLLSMLSFFGLNNFNEKIFVLNKIDLEPVVTNIKYETKVIYNEKLPSNIEKVIQKGENGMSEDNKIVKEAKAEIIEKGTGAYGIFKGRLVGYGPDCPGCSIKGNVACKTADKKIFSLIADGIYYEDSEYGSVRILATDLKKFPCGTIIKVEKEDGTVFMAIVLDRIGTKSETPLFDLAYSSEKDKTVFNADKLTGKNITFNVQRWGF